MTSETQQRRDQLIELCSTFPEVDCSGDNHLAFKVRKRSFAYYLNDHHGDGRIGLCCKSTIEEQDFLLQLDPERFYRPAYLGHNGWIGLRIDTPTVDWDEIRDFVTTAYRLTAPKRLVAQLDV
ncbi:MAG: MmcQ/YjbR family DNA-binding protein [Anaerolineae bacterium]|nr:MmcQ/YjbR family DNA-binding protein [Anaerolineae bacterium]